MELHKTALHNFHVQSGAKMVPFAGYDMPIQYKTGIIAEIKQVREQTGFFDVSHMGQIELSGPNIAKFISSITPSNFETLGQNVCKYTVLTNPNGGIIDDLIITKLADDKFFAVINAGCKDKDIQWIGENLEKFKKSNEGEYSFTIHYSRSLIAVQGRGAVEVLSKIFPEIPNFCDVKYMTGTWQKSSAYENLFITRTGYTGEDGFEVSIENKYAENFVQKLIEHNVLPIGLGARDVLRLEMGYPLYGHDISDATTPVEVGLSWVISKDHEDYIGAGTIIAHKTGGAPRARVGLKLLDKIVAREGAEIYKNNTNIGTITSGGFSPIVNGSIAMGLIPKADAIIGSEVEVEVRNKRYKAEIVKMPFVSPSTKK